MDQEATEIKPKNIFRKKFVIITVSAVIIAITAILLYTKYAHAPEHKVHYHAGFIVVKDNSLVDFSVNKYMDFEPCTADPSKGKKETPAELQVEKAHLHENIGDVVHVEAEGAKWSDLFTNLKYDIDYAYAYIDGQRVDNFQNTYIKPYQSAVIFQDGNVNTDKFLPMAVTKEHIVETEGKSEVCGS